MAWTTPLTAVANAPLTDAQWNASVRDNLLETAPAKATNTGSWFVTNGVNSIAQRGITSQSIFTGQTTTSTSFTDLATVGPVVSVTTNTQALVFVSSRLTTDTAGQSARAAHAVSGASTVAASDNFAVENQTPSAGLNMRATSVTLQSGLTPGSNTFTIQYRVTGGTGTFGVRHLIVMGM